MVNGTVTNDPKVISQHVALFYQNLYSSNLAPSHIESFLDNISRDTRKINDEFRDFCEMEISSSDIAECVKSLKENKSPGSDGLTGEFYKAFILKLAPFLLAIFKEAIQKDELPTILKQGVIT